MADFLERTLNPFSRSNTNGNRAKRIDAAHQEREHLGALWNKFFALCDCVPLKTVPEAEEMFAGFEPIDD